MKKNNRLISVLLSAILLLAGCSNIEKGRDAIIGADVNKVGIIHVTNDEMVQWTVSGDEIDALREWASGCLLYTSLLIAASGSGNTKSTLAVVECATHVNAKTILITGNNNSEIAKIAGSILYIPIDEFESIQYQGNCYDEAQFILQDTIIYKARNKLNLSRADMNQNHTNIE